MACVHLASKIEEAPRRIRDVIGVFHHIKQVRNQRQVFFAFYLEVLMFHQQIPSSVSNLLLNINSIRV